MALEAQTYNQKVDSASNQFTRPDKGITYSNRFKLTTQKIWFTKDGFAEWSIDNFTGLFPKTVYTVCSFDTINFESTGINIYKDSEDKFRVGKTGLYKINAKWLTSISSPSTTKADYLELWVSKNGSEIAGQNFKRCQVLGLHVECTGVTPCEWWEPVCDLQGTVYMWLEKDSDYIEVKLKPDSTLDLNAPDSHDGRISMKFETNRTKEL